MSGHETTSKAIIVENEGKCNIKMFKNAIALRKILVYDMDV